MKTTTVLLSATAIALTASFAQAATMDVAAVNSSSVFKDANGQNVWAVGTSFSVGTQSVNAGAGVFRVTGTDENNVMSNFLAFCLQPLESLTLPKSHLIDNPFAQAVSDNLQALATNAWGLVTSKNTAAAFQMAAWEITTETASAFDIDDGFFKITGNGTASNNAEGLAQTWLDYIADDTWSAGTDMYRILTASGTQDLLTNVIEQPVAPPPSTSPVPVPASGLLLIGGLLGAGFVARRRKS